MKHLHLLLTAALCLVCLETTAEDGPSAGQSAAALWLAGQVDALSRKVYVYSDYSDSRNTFTQRGAMTSHAYIDEPRMDEAWPDAYSGITSIRVDLILNSASDWAGCYFGNGIQEASGSPRFDWGDHEAGMDLRGATKLVFHARAVDNRPVSVNFLVGGNGKGKAYPDSGQKETGYVALTPQWKRFEIDLKGVNLSYISGGFGWVTNFSNITDRQAAFLLDDIYYEFAAPRADPVFPASYAAVPLSRDGYFINSVAYSYDLAITVIALACAGKTEQAYRVADGLLFALRHDRRFSHTERGLRNGYAAGNPASFPGWVSSGGSSPFAKLAGFFDINAQEWWEDYYSDSFSTGNNAWAILAFLEVYRRSGNTGYLRAACDIADYIHTLKDDVNGGFKGGWEGFDDTQQQAGYISTEHCIDIFSAFTQLADELTKMPAFSRRSAQFYKDGAAHARAFVMRMYDPDEGLFYTGTKPDGVTINRDVYPLDANTWGLLAFHNDPAINPARILATIERRFAVDGLYDFDDSGDGVWYEGSCQKVVVEKTLGNDAKYREQLALLNAAAQDGGSITAADRDGVSTGIWLEGVDADGSPKGNEWKYDRRVHTGATAWLALAQLGVNPLDPLRSASGNERPAAAQIRSYVSDGRLCVVGLVHGTPVNVYSIAGQQIASTAARGDIFSCPLPSRGAYVVTAGTESLKAIY